MRAAIRWAIENTPAMNMLLMAIMVIGIFGMTMMRREVFPEFELEILLVSVPYPGASPEEVEEGICQKIEEAVQSIDGIKKQISVAQENAGFVVLELQVGANVQKVLSEVRSEIDRIPSFPELAEDPEVQQITFRFPAIRVGVLGPPREDEQSEIALRELAERVRDDLLLLQPEPPRDPLSWLASKIRPRLRPTVISSATILGAKPYQIDIEVSERTLREHGLSLQQIAQIVRRQNVELPGGRMKTDADELLLVGKNKRTVGHEIEEIVVLAEPDGDEVTVGDLGRVRDGFADETMITRVDGRPAMVIEVSRTSSEDLYEVVESVKRYVATKQLPPGYELRTWYDQSIDVRDRMNTLLRNGLQGLLLVFFVLAIFLELRLAFWVALGIPVAVLGAGGFLLFAGHTLNMLSMFAFLMALGIVVDDAIVIGENVYHHRQLGKPFVQAAIDGTLEVIPSVVASVMTTVIAFMPMLFVAGVMGKFIGVLPVAVIAMLLISLVESIFILPCHLAHHDNLVFRLIGFFFFPFRFLVAFFRWLGARADRLIAWVIERIYLPLLARSLRRPAILVSGAVGLLMVAIAFERTGITPFVIFPKLDSRFIEAVVTFPNGTPAAETVAATKRLEDAIVQVDRQHAAGALRRGVRGKSLIRVRHRMVGYMMQPSQRNPTGTMTGSHLGAVMVELVPPDQRVIKSQQILDWWREAAGEIRGAESVVFRSPSFGPAGIPIEFKLLAKHGFEDQLVPAAEYCKEVLRQFDGVYDIDDDWRSGKWELQLQLKEEGRALGLTLADLAETVRAAYYGEEVMRLQRGRHEVKLMVRYPPDERRSLADFEQIRVRGRDLVERPITEVAKVSYERGIAEINRINQMRSITVMADVDESRANARQIVQKLQQDLVPQLKQRFPGIEVRWEGQQEQTQESIQSLFVGMGLALVAMYVLLTVEFRSYLQPVIIMSVIPFGMIGAVAGHALFGMDLTLFSVFGLVALTGVVVNDSIVLVDFINSRVRGGMALEQALVEAGGRRFRAVLLTSVTTIAGLVPLLLERSFQAQVLIPMAVSLCFGLMMTTLLVLFLVPTFYLYYERWTVHFRRRDPDPVVTVTEPATSALSTGGS